MNKLSARLLCQIYWLLILLAATIMSAMPHSLLVLLLLLALLFSALHPVPPRFNVAITVAAIFLSPVVLAPLLNYWIPFSPGMAQVIAAAAILPAIYLLDYHLRQNTQHTGISIPAKMRGRNITSVSRALSLTALVILFIAFIINNPALLLTDIIFALYLLSIMVRVLLATPGFPIDIATVEKRTIAGSTVNISLNTANKAPISLRCLISPLDPWVKVNPEILSLNREKTVIDLTLTPPLAGPSHPRLRISALDPRGFVQITKTLEPAKLQVIPRARFAEWLATKYLERTGTGSTAATLPARVIRTIKRGGEFFDSRTYQPGDQLKDIDWKHTLKLSQLIIKEYIEAGERAAILATNLSVSGAEEADKLAFNLITAALTLARESIPTALAAYNHQRVVQITAISDPREILKQTLSLVKDIASVEFAQRWLQPADISKLRRNITHLKAAKSEPAQRLLGILTFEQQAIEEVAKNNPATIALSKVTTHTPVPAMIILVSQLNHDAEALMVTTEKLARRQFTTIPI